MILIITTAEHAYTHEGLPAEGINARTVSYDELLRTEEPADAIHIFTDLDRLPPWKQLEAALFYRKLKGLGRTALNDPARVLGRFGLLRGLYRIGVNSFNAYRVEERVMPERWPLFLRMEGSHAPPASPLLHNIEQLATAINRAVSRGYPLATLLIVEYAAEPVRPGLFRRLSVFRIGDRLIGHTSAHDDNWIVKYGKPGIAPPELYEEEYAMVANNPFAESLRSAFDLAGVEYGRADFGLLQGRPQIYEINTNPELRLRPEPSPAARRNDTVELFRRTFLEALKELDEAPRPTVEPADAPIR